MTPNASHAQNAVRGRAPVAEYDEPEFAVGDRVRLSWRFIDDDYRKKLLVGHVKKSISQNWSHDIYTIGRVIRSPNNRTETYLVRDPDGVLQRRKYNRSDLLRAKVAD